jgi:hypothetical protein
VVLDVILVFGRHITVRLRTRESGIPVHCLYTNIPSTHLLSIDRRAHREYRVPGFLSRLPNLLPPGVGGANSDEGTDTLVQYNPPTGGLLAITVFVDPKV